MIYLLILFTVVNLIFIIYWKYESNKDIDYMKKIYENDQKEWEEFFEKINEKIEEDLDKLQRRVDE